MTWGWKETNPKSQAEDMRGWRIYCFDCKKDVASKSSAARGHKGHEVDWVNKTDGRRYS